MAKDYKPHTPFSVAMKILTPITQTVHGVVKKTFTTPEESPLIFGSFRTFGGTETTSDDVYTVLDTATIDTWYNPLIKADSAIYICQTGETYNVIGTPENINMRNQFMQLKVKKTGGKP